MSYRGDGGQKEMIDKFNQGECRLIVSTSVLEEGIDVATCDTVFRYGGSASLIQIIQSKGRARSKDGKLFVLLTEDEKKYIEKVVQQDAITRQVLQSTTTANDEELSNDLVSKLEAQETYDEGKHLLSEDPFSYTISFDFEIFATFKDTQTDSMDNQEILKSAFRNLPCVLERIDISLNQAQYRNVSFLLNDAVVLLLAKVSSNKFFEELFRVWNFVVNDHIALMSIPNHFYSDANQDSSNDQKKIPVMAVCAGYFDGKRYFAKSYDLKGFKQSTLVIEVGRCLTLISTDRTSEIEANVKDLDSYISVSFNKDGHLTLYVPLLHTPKAYKVSDDDRKSRVFLAYPSGYSSADESIEADLFRISKSAVIAIKVHIKHFERILEIFGDPCNCGIPAYVTRITDTDLADVVAFPKGLSKTDYGRDIAWEYARLQSDGVNPWVLNDICLHITDYIESIDETDVTLRAALASLRSLDLYKNLKRYKEFYEKYILLFETNASFAPQQDLSIPSAPGYMLVDRVIFTPSRFYILPAVPVKSNRMLRKFHDNYRFVYVSFRDERFQRIFGQDIYHQRFLAILQKGFDVVDEHYSFLCCSNSQMREGIAVFFNGSSELAERIRRSLLPDPSVSEEKYASRIGLFCTADYNTVPISDDDYDVVEDIFSKKKMLTDGAGLVSQAICDEVQKWMGTLDGNTFQIRYKGFKGILTLDPNLKESKIQFRKSMKKFNAQEGPEELGVVKVFGFTSVTLNRDMLTLISCLSTEGVTGGDWLPAPYIMELLDNELRYASEILLNRIAATEALDQYFPHFQKKILQQMNIDIICEPMWLRMLQLIYISKIRRLRVKTHIPVEKGALLVGVPDPRQVLGENEVFVCIEHKGNPFILDGSVLIYRNPSLNPGDLRVVTAVDKPELRYLKNVLVMPASSDVPSSLAAECSGGDNDGDEYSVIWDPNLVPPVNRVQDPFDYDVFQSKAKEKLKQIQSRAPNYFETVINNMANQMLGKIAHMFVAIADIKEDGARNPIAALLAGAQCLAVDFPKTGVPPEIPPEAREIIRTNGYPDFMEKKGLSYISKKPLGELYRRCVSITSDAELDRLPVIDGIVDPRFLIDGREKYKASARADYAAYMAAMRVLMVRYDLNNEFEVLLGIPTSWLDDELTSNCGASLFSLKDHVKALIKHFHDVFFHDPRLGDDDRERFLKASAWYEEAYTDRKYLSFPWVVCDVLAELLESSTELRLYSTDILTVLHEKIGWSFRDVWCENLIPLRTVLAKKEQLFTRIRFAVHEFDPALEVERYGSVELLLCDAISDLDLCAPISYDFKQFISEDIDAREIEIDHLDRNIGPAIDKVVKWKDVRKAAFIPIIRAEVDGDHIDLCAREDGLYKARLIRILYSKCNGFLLLLSNMMHFGQVCGLLRCIGSDQGTFPIKNGEFHAIFVDFMLRKYDLNRLEILTSLTNYVREDDDTLLARGMSCDCEELGGLLLDFLEYGVGLAVNGKFVFKWPVPGNPVHEVSADAMRKVSNMCLRAMHSLGLTRSWALTLQHAADAEKNSTSFTLLLSPRHSEILSPYRRFHQLKLSRLSGCNVTLVATDTDDNNDASVSKALEIRASGRPYEIYKLRLELSKLLNSSKSLYAGVVRTSASKYFMEGSTYMFAQGAESMQSMMEVDDYLGPIAQRAHRQLGLSKLSLRSDRFEDWQSIFISGIKEKITSQLRALESSRAQTLRLSLHFGHFYLIRANLTFDRIGAVSLKDVELCLANNKRMRKTDDRPDFDPTGRVNFSDGNSACDESKANESRDSASSSKKGSSSAKEAKNPKINQRLACGFYSSLCGPEFLATHEDEIMGYERELNEALVREGFALTNQPVTFKVGNYCNGTWLLDVKASASYEAAAALDDRLNVLGVAERPLAWVHGTLLGASTSAQPTYDLRFKLTTSKLAADGDPLYNFACPGGKAPISVNEAGNPIPRDDLPEQTQNRVMFARRVDRRVSYEFNDGHPSAPLHIVAVLIRGVHFEGLRLEESMEVFDFSLEVDLSPLVEGMDNGAIDTSDWLSRMLTKVVQVCNQIPLLSDERL